MHYLSLRFQVYQHSVKTAVAALAELLTFLMMVLYLAIPAMVFTALISLSVIEDIREPISVQAQYQGIYLAITFLLIRIQKRAILGGENQYYFSTLPTPMAQRGIVTAFITLIAGNFPLLTPAFLLTYISSFDQLAQHAHFAFFSVTVLATSAYCILRKRPPLLTFLFLTVVALMPDISGVFNDLIVFNVTLLLTLMLEFMLQKAVEERAFISLKLRTKAYWQLRITYIFRSPFSMTMRLVLTFIFIGLIAFMQMKLAQIATNEIQIICCYVIGLLIGSMQFEHQTFKTKYHYYLNLEHISPRRCLLQEMLFSIFFSLFFGYLAIALLGFSLTTLVTAPLMALITAVSVIKVNKSFFIPSAFLTLILVVFNI